MLGHSYSYTKDGTLGAGGCIDDGYDDDKPVVMYALMAAMSDVGVHVVGISGRHECLVCAVRMWMVNRERLCCVWL